MSQAASPEFFSFTPSPAGVNPAVASNALTGARIGLPELIPGLMFAPAKPADLVTAFGTGWGETNPAVGLGLLPSRAVSLTAKPSLTVGGVSVPDSGILYAGVAPHFAGLYQVNFVVPMNVPAGNQPLVI